MTQPLPPAQDVLLPPSLPAWLLAALGALAGAAALGTPVSLAPRQSNAVFDLERDLPKADVSVRKGATSSPCTWQAGDQRFRCGDEPWAFVGPYAGTTAGHAWRCTWAHPVAAGATTVLRWPAIALGAELSARLGLVDAAPEGPPLRLKVWIDQDLVAELETRSSADLAEVTKATAGRGPGELRLELSASDHALRMACLDVRMRDPRTAKRVGPEAR